MVADKRYKQTEVGLIPSDWAVKELGEICHPSKTRIYPLTCAVNHKCIELEHLAQGSGTLLGHANSKDLKSQKSVFRKGDVLFGKLRPYLRKYYLADFNGVCTTEIWVLKTHNDTLNGFLYQLIQSNKIIEAANLSTGTKMPRAEWKTVSETKIPLPPLPEQAAIAEVLSDMDALIAQTERLIEKKKAIKKGVMQELLRPKEGWVTRRLGDVCEIIMGQSPSSANYNSNGLGLPLIQGNADISNRRTIMRIFTTQITKRSIKGDIIMTVRAPVGEVSKTNFDCCLGRGVCAIRYTNDFMYHLLINKENEWVKFSSGSTFDSINSKQLNNIEVSIPKDILVQESISDTLSTIDNEIATFQSYLEKILDQKQGMMQSLLTGRIRLI